MAAPILKLTVYGVCSHSLGHILGTASVHSYSTPEGLCRTLSSMADVGPGKLVVIAPADVQNEAGWSVDSVAQIDAMDFMQALVDGGVDFAEEQQMLLTDEDDPSSSDPSNTAMVAVMLAADKDPCSRSSSKAATTAPAAAAADVHAHAHAAANASAVQQADAAINSVKKAAMDTFMRHLVPGDTPEGLKPFTYPLPTDNENGYKAGLTAMKGYAMHELILTNGGAAPKGIPIPRIQKNMYQAVRSHNFAVRRRTTETTYGDTFQKGWKALDPKWQLEFGESFKAEKAQKQQPRLRRSAAAGPCIPEKYLKFFEMGKCASWTDAMDVLERHNKDAAAAAAAGKATAPGASQQKKRKAARQPAAAAAEQEEEAAAAEQDDEEESEDEEEQQQEEGAQGQQKQAIPERQRPPTAAAAGAAALVNSRQVAKRIKQASQTAAAAAAAAAKADDGAGKKKGAATAGRGARKGNQRT